MPGDESTLPEGLAEALVRAGHSSDEPSAALVGRVPLQPLRARARARAARGAPPRAAHDAALARGPGRPRREVRREALTLVAHEPLTPALAAGVRERLGDDDALVVDAAAFALGEHHDAAAVDALSRVARDHADARCARPRSPRSGRSATSAGSRR